MSTKFLNHLCEQIMDTSRKRKAAPELDRSEVERKMRLRKLKSMEEHADFSFIVGTEKETEVSLTCNRSIIS